MAVVRETVWTTKIKLSRLVTERLALCNSRQREVKRVEGGGGKLGGIRDQSVMLRLRWRNLRNNTVQIFCHTAGVMQNFALEILFDTDYSDNFFMRVKIYI